MWPGRLAHPTGEFSLVPMYLTQCGHANTSTQTCRPASAQMFSHRCLYFISYHDNPQDPFYCMNSIAVISNAVSNVMCKCSEVWLGFFSAIETKVISSLIKCCRFMYVCVFTDKFPMLCKNGTFFMHTCFLELHSTWWSNEYFHSEWLWNWFGSVSLLGYSSPLVFQKAGGMFSVSD